MEPRLNAQPAN